MPKGMPRARHPELYGGLKPNPLGIQDAAVAQPPASTGWPPSVAQPVQAPAEDDAPDDAPDDSPDDLVEEEHGDRIKELEAKVAELLARLAAGRHPTEHNEEGQTAAAEPETVYEPPDPAGENILIHILEDGFTALGQVWYRGQELEFTPGSPAHRDTFDRNGNTWLDLRDKDFAQVERWGNVMFRSGPWPGKSLREGKVQFDQLKSLTGDGLVPVPGEKELAEAEAAEARRRRAAPRLRWQ